MLLHIVEFHPEGRTFVFLDADIFVFVIHPDAIASRESSGRQREIDCCHTVFIRRGRQLLHLFSVGIEQVECHPLALEDSVLIAVRYGIDHRSRMHRLSWTIDGPVGKDVRTLRIIVIYIIPVTVSDIHLRTGLVVVGIGKHLATSVVLALIQIFSLGIRPYIRDIIFVIGYVLLDAQVGIGDRLARSSTDHHITGRLVRQTLCHRIDIRHEIELTDHLRRWIRRELQHIDAYGQSFERQGVLEDVVGLFACIDTLHLHGCLAQQGLYFLVAFGIVRTDIDVAIGIHLIHLQLQRRYMAQIIQFDDHILHRLVHLKFITHAILRVDQPVFLITERIHPLPTAPAVQGVVDIAYFLFCRHIALGGAITGQGQFTSLRQVTIDLH